MAEETPVDQEFITYVVQSIVDNPEAVEVTRTVDEMGVLLSVKVAPEDMGNLIGRSGSTAKALRTLLRIIGAKHNARVNLKILEPEGGKRAPERAPVQEESAEESSEETSVDDVLDELGQE